MMNKDLEKLERLKANGIDVSEYYTEEINANNDAKAKYEHIKEARRERRNDPNYRKTLNAFKRIYYKEFYKKVYFQKWTVFERECGLKYSLENVHNKVTWTDNAIRQVLEDPYMIKYLGE